MRVTCDNVKNDGWCKLGGGLKLTLKLEQHGDDAIAASGTLNLREDEQLFAQDEGPAVVDSPVAEAVVVELPQSVEEQGEDDEEEDDAE